MFKFLKDEVPSFFQLVVLYYVPTRNEGCMSYALSLKHPQLFCFIHSDEFPRSVMLITFPFILFFSD